MVKFFNYVFDFAYCGKTYIAVKLNVKENHYETIYNRYCVISAAHFNSAFVTACLTGESNGWFR